MMYFDAEATNLQEVLKCRLSAAMQAQRCFKRFENTFCRHVLLPTSAYQLPCDFFKLVDSSFNLYVGYLPFKFFGDCNTNAGVQLQRTIVLFYRKTYHFWRKSHSLFFGSQPYSATLAEALYQNYGQIPVVGFKANISY